MDGNEQEIDLESVSKDELFTIRTKILYDVFEVMESDAEEISEEELKSRGIMITKLNILDSLEDIYDKIEHADDVVYEGEFSQDTLANSDIDPDILKNAILFSDIYSEVLGVMTTAALLLEELSIDLIKKEVISEKHEEAGKTDRYLQRMTQKNREHLLLRTGTIEQPLHGKISGVRIMRNNIVHNPENSALFLDIDNLESEIGDCLEAVNELEELVFENPSNQVEVTISSEDS